MRLTASLSALACAALASLALPVRALSIEPPPLAPVKPVTDTYFGTVVNDPYRWLEQVDDPAVQQWMRAQADYARAVLDAIPGRDALLKRINQLDAATPARVIDVQRRPGGRLFFQQRGARDNQFKLYVRDAKGTRLLVDPEQVAKQTGTPHAINYMQPSWSGRYVAYGLSAAGSEDASLYVIDATSGRPVLGPITRAAYGAIGWLPDDSGLFFNRLQEMTPGMPAIEKFQKTRAVFVRLADGAPSAADGDRMLRHKDGHLVWGRLTLRAWNASDGTSGQPRLRNYLLVLEDTTERKISEEQLQVLLTDQQTLLETMSVGVVQASGGRILLANREFSRLFDYEDHEVVGMSLWELARDHANRMPHEVSGLPAVREGQTTSAEVVRLPVTLLATKNNSARAMSTISEGLLRAHCAAARCFSSCCFCPCACRRRRRLSAGQAISRPGWLSWTRTSFTRTAMPALHQPIGPASTSSHAPSGS